MKTTSILAPSGEQVRVPFRLAERLVVAGLTPAATRLAIVLTSLAAVDGSWTINKPVLERMTGVVMNNAFKILAPLEEATLVMPATAKAALRHVRLFEDLDYVPGKVKKTAGMVTARLTQAAKLMLHGTEAPVIVEADEFRRYTTMGGIVLRMRLGARMAMLKGAKIDTWKLTADDLPFNFAVHADKWSVSRKSKAKDGDAEERVYVSLSRASQTFFVPGMDEISDICLKLHAKVGAVTLSDDPRSRWKAIVIETRQSSIMRITPKPAAEPAPAAKPRMSELNDLRRDKLPAYAKKQRSVKV